jgi:hypothetical protein
MELCHVAGGFDLIETIVSGGIGVFFISVVVFCMANLVAKRLAKPIESPQLLLNVLETGFGQYSID